MTLATVSSQPSAHGEREMGAVLLSPSVMAAAQSGNLSVTGVVSQVIAGGAGGAILTALVGAIKNKAAA